KTDSSNSNPHVKFSLMSPSVNDAYLTLQNINDAEVETNICEKTSQKSALFDQICFECNISVLATEETTWNTIHSKPQKYQCGDTVKLLPMEIRTFKLSLHHINYVPSPEKKTNNHWFIYFIIVLYLVIG